MIARALRSVWPFAGAVLVALHVNGCYTLFRHPQAPDLDPQAHEVILLDGGVYYASPYVSDWYGHYGPYSGYCYAHPHLPADPSYPPGPGNAPPHATGFGRGGRDGPGGGWRGGGGTRTQAPKPPRDSPEATEVEPDIEPPPDDDADAATPPPDATLGGRGGRR